MIYKVELCSTLYTTRQGQIKSLVCRTTFDLIWPVSLNPQIQKTKTNSWRLFCKSKLENKWKKYILQLRKKKKKKKKKNEILLDILGSIFCHLYTLPHICGGVLWYQLVVRLFIRQSICRTSVRIFVSGR